MIAENINKMIEYFVPDGVLGGRFLSRRVFCITFSMRNGMNRKMSMLMVCIAISSLMSCNETVKWQDECSGGERACDNNRVMVCKEGAFVVESECTGDLVCDTTKFECVPPVIKECDTAGAKKCDGKNVMICEGGRWTVSESCEISCNETTKACDKPSGDCTDGATRCPADSSKIEKCTGGSWVPEDCSVGTCVTIGSGAVCAECDDDATRCVVEDGVSKLSKCTDHVWAAAQACADIDPTKAVCDANPGSSCVDVKTLLSCPTEGDVACQTVYGKEYAVTCHDGAISSAEMCVDDKVCDVPSNGCTERDVCGNGTIGAGEDCEEGLDISATCADLTEDANATGTVSCASCQYDISACLYCGDNKINNSEQCDGILPEGASCTSVMDDGKVYTGELSCNDDCTLNTSACTAVPNACIDFNETVIADGEKGCISETEYGTCSDGEMGTEGTACTTEVANALAVCVDKGECGVVCKSGYENSGESCAREVLACNFQWIAAEDGAFGNIALNGKTKDDYNGRLVCIDQADATDIVTLDAVFNKTVDEVNAEFGVVDLSSIGAGKYLCTFEFKRASSESWFACQGVDYTEHWDDPILIEDNDYSKLPTSGWYREYQVQLCTPNARVCDGDGTKLCSADGMRFGEVEDCPTDANGTVTCTDGVCGIQCNDNYTKVDGVCTLMICEPDEKKCEDNNVMVCNSTRTGFEVLQECKTDDEHATIVCEENACKITCEGEYVEVDGHCLEIICETNEKKCEDDSVKICNSTRTGFEVLEECTTDDENATAFCEDEACKVKCNDNYIDVGGICTPIVCVPGEKECNGANIMICNTTGTGLTVDQTCEATDVNGVAYCEANTCKERCKDGYVDVDGTCLEVICEPGAKKCDDGGVNVLTCNTTGTDYDALNCTTDVENASAVCTEDFTCSYKCNSGYSPVDGACVAQTCTEGEKICNDTNDGLMVCKADLTGFEAGDPCSAPEHAKATCADGACGFECLDGYVKNADGTGCDREILACNFQWIAASDGAYGNIALNGKSENDYNGRVVCIDKADATNVVTLDAAFNKLVDGVNAEFGVVDISSIGAGSYSCTFEFKLAESNAWYACQGVDYSNHWDDPILVNNNESEVLPADGWYRDYSVQLCTPDSRICEGTGSYKVCAGDGMSYGEAQSCPTDPHGTATCSEGVCGLECTSPYVAEGNSCVCTGDYVLDGDNCVSKCTANNNKCEGDVYKKCNVSTGLMVTENKPGDMYVCDDDSGWVSVDCISDTDCPAPAHATMVCDSNVCKIASCSGNWSLSGDSCVCTGDYVQSGDDCVAKCTSNDNKCDGDVYKKCNTSTGLMETENRPGDLYICDDSEGWKSVSCIDASDCSPVAHATMACNSNACEIASCEGNWAVGNGACMCPSPYVIFNGDCVPASSVVCTLDGTDYAVGEHVCNADGITPMVCADTGEFVNDGTCAFACEAGVCRDARTCTGLNSTVVAHEAAGCKDETTVATCIDGEWDTEHQIVCNVANATNSCNTATASCEFTCNDGYVKNEAEGRCDREIAGCNFQWIGSTGAYGTVSLSGKTKDDYNGRLVCIDQADASHVVRLDAAFNELKNDVNAEFGVLDLSSMDPGNYNCTFEFKLDSSSTWFACQGVDYSGHWADPIVVDNDEAEVLPAEDWYRTHSVQLCVPDSRVCDGTDSYKVCASDGMSYGSVTACDTAVENGYAVCHEGACGFDCNADYVPDGSVCKATFCPDYAGKHIHNGDYGCQTETRQGTCVDGAWSTSDGDYVDCPNGCDTATNDCKAAESCTDFNNNTISPNAYGCVSATEMAQCVNGVLDPNDAINCNEDDHATAYHCVGNGVCESTACESNYHVDANTHKCVDNVCVPNSVTCSGDMISTCNADGSDYSDLDQCDIKLNATATAVCEGNAFTGCTYSCNSGYVWENGVENSTCVPVATLFCIDEVSGEHVASGDMGCATTTASAECINGVWSTELFECSEFVVAPANATAVCDPTDTDDYCGIKCADGYELSSDGSSCEKKLTVEWCKFQWLNTPQSAGGRILFPEGLGDEDVLAYLACTSNLSTPIDNWDILDASLNTGCTETEPAGNACGNNKEYMVDANSYTGAAGTNYCAFIFDFGSDRFLCSNDGGAGVPVTSDLVWYTDRYRTFESTFCTGKADGSYCDGDTWTQCSGGSIVSNPAPYYCPNDNGKVCEVTGEGTAECRASSVVPECVPGTTKCGEDADENMLYTCDSNGQWRTKMCMNGCDLNSNSQPVCLVLHEFTLPANQGGQNVYTSTGELVSTVNSNVVLKWKGNQKDRFLMTANTNHGNYIEVTGLNGIKSVTIVGNTYSTDTGTWKTQVDGTDTEYSINLSGDSWSPFVAPINNNTSSEFKLYSDASVTSNKYRVYVDSVSIIAYE